VLAVRQEDKWNSLRDREDQERYHLQEVSDNWDQIVAWMGIGRGE